jgi:hypothetical protein
VRLLLVVPGVAAMIGLAVQAHADPADEDATFLAALKNAGIPYRNADKAVAVGRAFCEHMDHDQTAPDVVNQLTVANPGISLENATTFAGIAVSVYCPQHLAGGSSVGGG